MPNNTLGPRSIENRDQCHADLILVINEAARLSQVDFTIIEGARSVERQQMLFNKGRSKVNPSKYSAAELITKGKHIVNEFRDESWAFDFIVYVPGRKDLTYDATHLMYLVGVFTAVAEYLYQAGEIDHKIRSGANWDRDGMLKYDQSFFDSPHIEMIK